MKRVDTSQFRDSSSAGQGSNVVDSPQNQLTVNGVGVMEGPCSCITKLLPVDVKVAHDHVTFQKQTAVFVSFRSIHSVQHM